MTICDCFASLPELDKRLMWPFAECRLKSNLQKSILAQTFSFNHHIPKANTLLEKVLLKKIFNL